MTLTNQLVASGQWLFRRRSYLPWTTVVVVLLGLRDAWAIDRAETATLTWEVLCLALSLCGLVLRSCIVGTTPIGTSGRNVREQVAFSLNTTGFYSIVRHPLYLANLLIVFGLVLYSQSVWAMTITLLSFWLFYERIMLAEESFLARKFGEHFEHWASVVPAFIPALANWQRPSLAFSWRAVLKREYNGFAAILILFVLMDFAGSWWVHQEIVLSGARQGMLAVALFVWLTLRSLRKYTRWLHVEGR